MCALPLALMVVYTWPSNMTSSAVKHWCDTDEVWNIGRPLAEGWYMLHFKKCSTAGLSILIQMTVNTMQCARCTKASMRLFSRVFGYPQTFWRISQFISRLILQIGLGLFDSYRHHAVFSSIKHQRSDFLTFLRLWPKHKKQCSGALD